MDHQTTLIIGIVVLALGLALVVAGRSGGRTVKARDISGTVINGDVTVNAARNDKPVRGWVEWTGWGMTLAGVLLGLWPLLSGK
jgi:hypothetical protein